jgi:hypothetical protein
MIGRRSSPGRKRNGHRGGRERQRRGDPDRRGDRDPGEHAAQRRPEHETETERGADEPVRAGAIFRFRDVGDVGARRGDVSARQPVDDAREKEHREAVREREHHEADDGTGETEDEHRPPAVPVGQIAEDGRRDKLTDREDRKEQPDLERRGAERLRVKRKQRDDDPEADQVDENRQKDDEERTRHR